ncbi:MAG: hypothetical protein IPH74_15200 [Bacteroidetes bacterium]|nr:hypothetical protein [Bacteroidota bacterium]
MCGIAGVWNLNNKLVELNELEKFTDSLRHRGPDGSGYTLYDNETLGLRAQTFYFRPFGKWKATT